MSILNKYVCLAVLLMVGGAGCGNEEPISKLEGVYNIAGWSLGETCSDSGVALRSRFDDLLEIRISDGGLDAYLCEGGSACARAWRLDEGSDDSGWLGAMVNVDASNPYLCRANIERVSVTSLAENEIHVEVRHHGDGYFAPTDCGGFGPGDGEPSTLAKAATTSNPDVEECVPGQCVMEDAVAACESAGCIACEVIEAGNRKPLVSPKM